MFCKIYKPSLVGSECSGSRATRPTIKAVEDGQHRFLKTSTELLTVLSNHHSKHEIRATANKQICMRYCNDEKED